MLANGHSGTAAALKQNNMHPFHHPGINNQLRRQQDSEAVDGGRVIHGSTLNIQNKVELRQLMIYWMERYGNKGFTNAEAKAEFGDSPHFKEVYKKLKERGRRMGFLIFQDKKWYCF